MTCHACRVEACEVEGNTAVRHTCTLHAHVETHTRDCDGAITRSHVLTMTDEERTGEFGDIRFHERAVNAAVNTYSLLSTGHLTATRLGDGDVRLSWNEATDEGSRCVEVTLCTDDCDTDQTTYRDHAAEAAGY